MFCRYCGASVEDDSLFCSICGKTLSAEEPPEAPEQSDKTETKDNWLYRDGFSLLGPLTYEDLASKIGNREINFNGKVKTDSVDGDWIPLSQSVFAPVVREAFMKEVYVSDIWVWCLAVIPLFISIVSIVLSLAGISLSQNIWFWFAGFICLNILFLLLDKREIKKACIFVSWLNPGILLPPLYLAAREVKTNHNFSPAIINLFLITAEIYIFLNLY